MITVDEAFARIIAQKIELPVTELSLEEAVGKVLGEPIYADRDFPPYHRVTMDGIAIRYEAYQAGEDTFRVEGLQLAGAPAQTLTSKDECLEVMTGAILPKNTDTVIRYEDVSITERRGKRYAHILAAPKMRLQNVHQQGSDRRATDLLIPEGTILSPAEIAVAASVGKSSLKVAEAPRVAIISTGDELVEVTQTPLPHQIRKSNSYMLQAALREQGVTADVFHLADDKALLLNELSEKLKKYAVLVLSGGVSKGKADYIPEILQELGVEQLFHEVAQRPGKPFWFGKHAAGPVVFALPGNPVSTFVCYYKYIQPWLRTVLGAAPAWNLQAHLTTEVTFNPKLTYFLPVKIFITANGIWRAQPITIGGSGDFAGLLAADGFLELPPDQMKFSAGESFPLICFRG
ncbi:molybdopterin molybdotransferase MoeA [Adhaeribacter pallidiroseus]|uniref:Molybdopterin molybdenumtransferase n=1 Tax=Adhaeribacter pallidiroseus TaxID=2072847 RepID=A0A369QAK3_9BACT|nr:molybdopterin molybdotransferase MoeA [Adhaeribacter pallidiroseus]RDC61492.1 Molybdopterin molybdotransferase [Adhaeribacter pallidiroseus]